MTCPLAKKRAMILRMVEEGKISARRGLGSWQPWATKRQTVPPRSHAVSRHFIRHVDHLLRIRVSNAVTGKSKVNVNIPVGLVRLGLRFIPQSANIDAEKIMHALDTGLKGRIVDVVAEDEGTHVEIYVE